jgi:chlorobactene glucosyltransferase
MELFLLAVLGVLALMTVIVAVNCATMQTVRPAPSPEHLPFVSVLVPARNEERNLDACLASLAAQNYPQYEVVVLDDRSSDRTWEIIQRWASASPRIRGVRGGDLPQGWVGKNFACHQLFTHAAGELLLFTDADTVHSPESIRSAVTAMRQSQADLLSLLPRLRLESVWEKVVMPMLHFVTFGFLPFPLVHHTTSPKLAMANGQFMLFRRNAYERIGGHEAVKDALVEDVWLARRIKQFRLRLRVMDGRHLLETRMYTSLREIWSGFSKNLFPGFSFSLTAIIGVMLFNIATSIVPFVLLPYALTAEAPWLPLVVAQAALIVAMRTMIAFRFSLDLLPVVLHPLAMAVVVGIAANSVRWAHFADGIHWKGRRYAVRTDERQMTISTTLE